MQRHAIALLALFVIQWSSGCLDSPPPLCDIHAMEGSRHRVASQIVINDVPAQAMFDAGQVVGKGTADCPFRIRNLDFDATRVPEGGHALEIQDSRAHYLIENSSFHDLASGGILVINSTSVEIRQNDFRAFQGANDTALSDCMSLLWPMAGERVDAKNRRLDEPVMAAAISLHGIDSAIVTGNSIQGSRGLAIEARRVDSLDLSENTVMNVDGMVCGFRVGNVTLDGNAFRRVDGIDQKFRGIYLSDTPDGETIDWAPRLRDVLLRDNDFLNAEITIAAGTNGTSSINVTRNSFARTEASRVADFAVQLLADGPVTLEKNLVTNATVGIYSGSHRTRLIENQFAGPAAWANDPLRGIDCLQFAGAALEVEQGLWTGCGRAVVGSGSGLQVSGASFRHNGVAILGFPAVLALNNSFLANHLAISVPYEYQRDPFPTRLMFNEFVGNDVVIRTPQWVQYTNAMMEGANTCPGAECPTADHYGVNAENNWWGCEQGPYIGPCDLVVPTHRDPELYDVDFVPWLTQPPFSVLSDPQ